MTTAIQTEVETQKIKRHPLAIAWDEWLASEEGQRCRDVDILNTARNRPHLEARLWYAFNAGARTFPLEADKDTTIVEVIGMVGDVILRGPWNDPKIQDAWERGYRVRKAEPTK